MAQILDGIRVRDEILNELRPRITALPRRPGLAVVLVGSDAASEVYVGSKVKTCASLGLLSEKITRPETITTAELLALVDSLNANEAIDGILVQMPPQALFEEPNCACHGCAWACWGPAAPPVGPLWRFAGVVRQLGNCRPNTGLQVQNLKHVNVSWNLPN